MNETRSQKSTGNRKAAILETVANMLEKAPGDKITIAKIAADVGVSEAAIYRHFASKAQIFEALITFAEEALLSRINTIHASCLLYTSPSPRDLSTSRMPSSA